MEGGSELVLPVSRALRELVRHQPNCDRGTPALSCGFRPRGTIRASSLAWSWDQPGPVIRLAPNLPQLLKRLVIMGGSFNDRGNTTPVAECDTHEAVLDAMIERIATLARRTGSRRPR
ncbi:nucleoside hydrolase [Arthrobacter pigmenti]|uniref:nucleoside hydrolase n=1 Tax=Arthrobacter pigmenti TaxID=271432 RepID=UPI003CC90DE7